MGWEPVNKCIVASKQHSRTTRRLVEDSLGDKRVFTGMHEILKAKIGELEDAINVNDKALGDAFEEINVNGKAMSGDIDEVKGRMAAMEDDMKEIKDLLIQLVQNKKE